MMEACRNRVSRHATPADGVMGGMTVMGGLTVAAGLAVAAGLPVAAIVTARGSRMAAGRTGPSG
jgi:hypothetical protein